MKISVMSHCFYKEFANGSMNFEKFISFCKEIGADGVELSDHHLLDSDFSIAASVLEDSGLELPSFIIVADLVQPDENEMQIAVDKVISKIERACLLGNKHIMISPGGIKSGIDLQKTRDIICIGLEQVIRCVSDKGIRISVENHGGLSALRGKIVHMQEFIQKIPGLSLSYDSGNYLIAGEDPLKALDELYEKTIHVHLKDYMIAGGGDGEKNTSEILYKAVTLGEGKVPTCKLIDYLNAKKYTGFLSIEYNGDLPPEIGVKMCIDYLRKVTDKYKS